MTAPVRHDLYVIYNVEDPEATATTLSFPTAADRDIHVQTLKDKQSDGEMSFQLVPGLRFIRFQSKNTLGALSRNVRAVIEPLISRRKLSTAPWFIDPATGQHVKRHWEPNKDMPIGKLSAFEEKLAEPIPAARRRTRPGR